MNKCYTDCVSEFDLNTGRMIYTIPVGPKLEADDIEYMVERVSHCRHLASGLMIPNHTLYHLEQRSYLFEIMKTMITAVKAIMNRDTGGIRVVGIESCLDLTEEKSYVIVSSLYCNRHYKLKFEYIKRTKAFFLSCKQSSEDDWHFIDQYFVKHSIYSYDMAFPYPSRFRQIIRDCFDGIAQGGA